MKNIFLSGKTISLFIVLLIFFFTGIFLSTTNAQCLVSGTKTIPGDYPSLTAAVADLQSKGLAGSVILELQPTYPANPETLPITLGVVPCASAAKTITIRPALSTINTGLTTFNAAPTIEINGGNYWIIDGRRGGTGTSSDLTFSNASGSAGSCALRFVNNASNNIIRYVKFAGSFPSSTSGVITFGSTSTTGNSNNSIENCSINGNATATSPTANVSQNGIYAGGNPSAPNINNTILNCNIFDCFVTGTSATSSGISISTGNSDWIIDGNSIYYTTAKVNTSGTSTMIPINIANTSGNNFYIRNNCIGGDSPNCVTSGTGTTLSGGATKFTGISLSVGSTLLSNVQGNKMANITITSSLSGPFEGISGISGDIFIGDAIGNQIGYPIGFITITSSGIGNDSKGIIYNPIVPGTCAISNNTIGLIEVYGTSTAISQGFIGIFSSGNNSVIYGNQMRRINANTASTTSAIQHILGIYTIAQSVNVSNNVIANFRNNYVPSVAATTPVVRGIVINGGIGGATGNSVHDLFTSANANGTGSNASVIGIQFLPATTAGTSLASNRVYSLYNTNSSQAVSVTGIYMGGQSFFGVNFFSNKIFALSASSPAATITGLYAAGINGYYFNNMVELGIDTLGNSLTTGCTINGIYDASNSAVIIHNTVYIGGTGVSNTANNTFAFNSSVTNFTRDYRNNIFINARSNTSAGGKHYAVQVGGTNANPPGLTLDYNIYQVTGFGGVLGRFNSSDVISFSAWKTSVGMDLNSQYVSPCLADPASGWGDLHLSLCGPSPNPADGAGLLFGYVTEDIDGETRSALSPVDIGADAGNYSPANSLGNYPAATLNNGGNLTVFPSAAPTGVGVLTVTTTPDFTGILSVEQATGKINITNAKPAGTYSITVKQGSIIRLFTLTVNVNQATCSNSNFTLQNISLSANPVSGVIGDFNNDGKQDLATGIGASIVVMTGNGLGGFSSASTIALTSNSFSLAVADFNGDGNQDIVSSNTTNPTLTVALGNGSGSFTVATNLNFGAGSGNIALGDFNSDRKIDLALSSGSAVLICTGNGSGSFSIANTISAGTLSGSIAVNDFNKDGKLDFVVTNQASNYVFVRLGDGLGGFSSASNVTVEGGPSKIITYDFNHDNNPDFASLHSSRICIRLGDGLGGFTGTTQSVNQSTLNSLIAGDFNGDNNIDLAYTYSNSSNVLTLNGSGTGTFTTASSVPVVSGVRVVDAGDFNHDNVLDIFAVNTTSANQSILLGMNPEINLKGNNNDIVDGSTLISPTINTFFGNVGTCNPVKKNFVIQNNGTGPLTITGITISGTNPNEFKINDIVFPATISGTGSTSFSVVFTPQGSGNYSATINVNNNDCNESVYDFRVEGTGSAATVGTYSNATVTEGSNIILASNTPPSNTQFITATASPNFKGLITADPVTGNISITDAKPAGVYVVKVAIGTCASTTFNLTVTTGCGVGVFGLSSSITGTPSPASTAIGDFNNDGNQDLVVSNNASPSVSIKYGNGAGTFSGNTNIPVGGLSNLVRATDFNGDGNLDFAVLLNNPFLVETYLGNGSGSFQLGTSIALSFATFDFEVVDINKDGKADLEIVNYFGGSVQMMLGDGAGSFNGNTIVSIGARLNGIAFGDFNNDGNFDFAVANSTSNYVAVRNGDGLGGFTGSANITVGTSPQDVTLADFNNDGFVDIAAACSNNVSVLLSTGIFGFNTSVNYISTNATNFLEAADLNSDGKPDLAVINVFDSKIFIQYNNGSGVFGNFSTGYFVTAPTPTSFSIGDFNEDGILDFAAPTQGGNAVSILTGLTGKINLQANSNNINNGSIIISTLINTDFGIVPLCNPHSSNYTINNNGAGLLIVTGISLSGANPNSYSVNDIAFPLTINPGGSKTFSIAFSPSSPGIKTATVNIQSSDCVDPLFTFNISGEGGSAPSLGNYSPASVFTGGNILVIPSSPPSNVVSLSATAPSGFTGILTTDPVSGNVQVTDAGPAGNYLINVSVGNCISQTFTLSVLSNSCSNATFSTATVNAGTAPQSVAVGDFNNDLKQDYVVANFTSNTLSVKLGSGLGTFVSAPDVVTGSAPYSVAVGDFNGDGKQDLAIANSAAANVSVRLGNGSGGFISMPDVAVGTTPYFVGAGDFNGDNFQDLAIANFGSNNVSIRLGNGLGNFGGNSTIPVNTSPTSIAIGDYNLDGKQDLAIANRGTSNVSVKIGDGAGGFSGTLNVNTGPSPNCIITSDFNQDGKPDIATANQFGSVSVLNGDGLGGFGSPYQFNVSDNTLSVVAGDFNGDGKPDIACPIYFAASPSSSDVVIGINNGLGAFTRLPDVHINGKPYGAAVGDFNTDGRLDIITANSLSNNSTVLLSVANQIMVTGNGNQIPDGNNVTSINDNTDFGTATACNQVIKNFTIQNNGLTTLIINSISLAGLNAGDFIVSGISLPFTINAGASTQFKITFLSSIQGTRSATVHINNNNCEFGDYDFAIQGTCNGSPVLGNYTSTSVIAGSNTFISPDISSSGINSITAATSTNFNGILSVDPVTGIVYVMNANPAGTYVINVTVGTCITRTFQFTVANGSCSHGSFVFGGLVNVGTQPRSVAVGDFNGDGKQDFATANSTSNTVSVRLGDGLGGFTGTNNINVGTTPYSVAIGDINSDGKQDFVASNFGSGTVSVRLGDGTGGFIGTTEVSMGSQPYFVALADFNNDNKKDIAVTNFNTNQVTVRFGDGAGDFQTTAFSSFVTGSPTSIAIGDFNNDGNQDMAITNSAYSIVNIKLGDGTGGFTNPVSVGVGNSPYSVAIGDFNRDGNQDIVTANSPSFGPFTASVRLGNGSGGFTGTANITISGSPRSVSVGDFNGDGNQDFATANFSNNISVCLGNGAGGFGTVINYFVSGNSTNSIATGDFNSDQIQDLVVANMSSGSVTIMKGAEQEINVQSNNTDIPDGSTSLLSINNTDFGIAYLNAAVSNTYTIRNSGSASLTINNISLSGVNSGAFTISGITIPSSLIAGASVTFNVTFNPVTTGQNTAVVHISNTDCNEGDYDFAIGGIGHYDCTVDINDFNECTLDACDPLAGITHIAIDVDDNDACTDDGCDTSTGVYHDAVSTDDGNACTDDGCDTSTGVYHNSVNTDDGNACTDDGCNTSTGIYHDAVNTDDGNACTDDGCDTSTGVYYDAVNTDDGNACTDDGCNTSTGVYHDAVNTDDGNACTDDGCDTSTGVYHDAVITDDGNACTDDGCDTSTGVYHDAVNTDDGNACTDDGCDTSTGVYHNAVNTDDGNACTIDDCDTSTGIVSNIDDSPTVTLTAADILCYQGTTCVEVNATGGLPPYLGTGSMCGYGAGTFVFTVTDSKGCSVDESITLTQPTKVTFTLQTIPCTCNMNNGTATASPSGGIPPYSYEWLPGGQTTPTATGLGAGNYTVTIADANGCTASASFAMTCSGNIPPPPSMILGPAGACKNQVNVTYSITPVLGATSYQWTLPTGATGTSTGTSITITFSNYAGGYICVKSINGCGSSANACLNVTKIGNSPSTPAKITGPSKICSGTSAMYSVPVVLNATTYNWTVSGNLSIASGQGSNVIVVSSPFGFTNGAVKVKAANCKGNSGERKIDVKGVQLITPGSINGSSSVCKSATKNYDVPNVSGATSYTWTISAGGGDIQSGQGTNHISVNFNSATTTSATLSVVANSICGTTSPGVPKTIAINLGCRTIAENGVEAEPSFEMFTVYPNPTSGKTTISFESISKTRFTLNVTDMLGKILIHDNIDVVEGINQKEIDLGNLANGIYMIRIESNNMEIETLPIFVGN